MNAGAIPADHWTQDPEVGGGRIVGEACHFIDLLRHLAGAPIVSPTGALIGDTADRPAPRDNAAITLGFADGSMAPCTTSPTAHKGFPKERVEVFAAGRVLQLDNFRKLSGWGWKGFTKHEPVAAGQGAEGLCGGLPLTPLRKASPRPIPAGEIFEVARVSIDVAESLRNMDHSKVKGETPDA